MTPDSLEYFVRVTDILENLPPVDPGTPAHFLQVPRFELVNVEVTRRQWLFWKRQETIKGLKFLTNMVFWSKVLQRYVVELESVTCDGATTPQIFWSIFPPFGKDEGSDYSPAAGGHDKYCRQAKKDLSPINSVEAALLFREIMQVLGVRTRIWRTMFFFVRWCGPRFKASTRNPKPGKKKNA